jgi:hypothetical protein
MPPFCRASLSRTATLPLLFICVLSSFAQRGAVTTHQSLDEMVQEADVIVQGSVLSAKVEPHPQLQNLTTVLVTLNVHDTLKGTAGKTFQFRQYVWDIRDKLDASRYAKGQEVLLLMTQPSQYGLSSPVGLEQGRFHITYEKGRAMAANGKNNAALFANTADRVKARNMKLSEQTKRLIISQTSGPVLLDDLKAAIRNLQGMNVKTQ